MSNKTYMLFNLLTKLTEIDTDVQKLDIDSIYPDVENIISTGCFDKNHKYFDGFSIDRIDVYNMKTRLVEFINDGIDKRIVSTIARRFVKLRKDSKDLWCSHFRDHFRDSHKTIENIENQWDLLIIPYDTLLIDIDRLLKNRTIYLKQFDIDNTPNPKKIDNSKHKHVKKSKPSRIPSTSKCKIRKPKGVPNPYTKTRDGDTTRNSGEIIYTSSNIGVDTIIKQLKSVKLN